MRLLQQKLRRALRQAADPTKAAGMQAYMKSPMPYLGVQTLSLRRVCRDVFAEVDFRSPIAWRREVLTLWREARFREERYAALYLAGDKRAAAFQTPAAMPMYEELIVTGAWWDFVDDIASHRVGPILAKYPRQLSRQMRAWSRCNHLWKRRTAILCQLSFKERTDLRLLYACIEPSLDSSEFFLQKAIGWALRQYAWTDAKEVRRYVRTNRARLSALSYREALKNIGHD